MNENHQTEEESEVDVEKVDIDLDKVRKFLSHCEIPLISSDTERLCLATTGLYSKKYKEALQIVQDKIMEKNQPINSTRPINYVDKELSVAINVLGSLFEKETLPRSNIAHLLYSPRQSEIRKRIQKNMKVNGEKMKERYAKRKRTKVEDFDIGDNVAPTDRGKGDVSRVPTVVVLKRGQVQAKYKLACRFGTIASFSTASSLISYPAPVDILDEGKTVSLREAARLHSVLKKDI